MSAKLSLEEFRQIAISRNGRCLSKKYINNTTELEWKCEEGHQWFATPKHIKAGSWCLKCAYKKNGDKLRGSIDELRIVAQSMRGKCLSQSYTKSNEKYSWECEKRHRWNATASSIKSGGWCPKCAYKKNGDKQRGSIGQLQILAQSKGGKCLSQSYTKSNEKYSWECEKGHQWEATASSIKSGSWCPKCAYERNADKQRGAIDELKALAQAKGGKCLSQIYTRTHDQYKWECKEKHQWDATAASVKSGRWCKKCSAKRRNDWKRGSIEKLKQLAYERGGYCLSTSYIDANTRYRWKCLCGYEWKTTAASVKSGRWCKKCNKFYYQEKCRFIIEILLGIKVPQKSNFLEVQLSTNKICRLELDGYSKSLNFAFEYNGIQHYEYVSYFHKNYENFKLLKEKDYLKQKTCGEKGIKLLVIPYTENNNLIAFIESFFKKHGIKAKIQGSEIKESNFKTSQRRMMKLHEAAIERDGKCLSYTYEGTSHRYLWVCENDHPWYATASSIKSGTWCEKCRRKEQINKRRQKGLIRVQEYASQYNGKCLSTKYKNGKTKLSFECEKGHQWEATVDSMIRNNNWCPTCAGRKNYTIDDMSNKVRDKGGKCLSKEYINVRTKLLWECKRGHQWNAIPKTVLRGHWCRACVEIEKAKKRTAGY
ncbi:hypothetical protein QQ020_25725 [Fulvivirgaceae bacterium BMA12]|uniref:Zinc-ribbon domain-containing protein n=1 Tax=Agaribacillus aureus TaxID=3051825 RepID=A0ABT8LCJ4_9BACT|nr:hypothetical protein [Fulvivirgaceae bacterium BMA12]